MSYIKYPHIMIEKVIRKLLVKQKKSMDEAAKILEVPYGCVKNQALKVLSDKEYSSLTRKRNRYTNREKRIMVKASRMKGETLQGVAAQNGVHSELLRTWARQYDSGLLRKRKKSSD